MVASCFARAAGRALALGVLALCACGPGPRPGTPPERLLLITLEALRADHCTALGYARNTTRSELPGDAQPLDLDALADLGVLFARAFAPAPDARAALEAVLDPRPEHGLAASLARAGWRTAAFVAPSAALLANGLEAGFERFELSSDDPAAFGAALDWSGELAGDERAFVWLHMGACAPPWEEEALADPYTALPPNEVDRYDGAIARTNAAVAGFLDAYRALPGAPLGRTLIVWAGTHGAELQREESSGPAVALEGRLRVPLVFSHTASLTGRRILAEPVELADLPPTLGDWLGLPAAEAARGRSLMPLMDSYVERPFERRPAVAAWDGRASLRTPDQRLVARVEAGTGVNLRAEGLALLAPYAPPREVALADEVELVESLLGELAARLASEGGTRE